MKNIFFLCSLLCFFIVSPAWSETYVSGVDDVQGGKASKLDEPTKKLLHESILNYYKDPKPEKIDNVLDIMANTKLLTRKTASAPLVGFLTVVFPNNKNHVMRWMSRNDYNTNAQYIIVNALMHARMKESALLFAKAHKWEGEDMYRLREMNHNVDLKNLPIVIPGHIDTLWGAFFASGDPIYVEQIINVMISDKIIPQELKEAFFIPEDADPMVENKSLAVTTLRDYAKDHAPVRAAIEARMKAEPENSPKYDLYKSILGK